MRLSNRTKSSYYYFINTLLLMSVIGGILILFLDYYKFRIFGWERIFFVIVPLILFAILLVRGRQIFEYDSDGETLIFKNRNIIPFFDKVANDEFPKYKLKSYEIFNALIFKRLYISIESKKSHVIILKYDISYLNKRQINDLKFSLSKAARVARKTIDSNIIEE